MQTFEGAAPLTTSLFQTQDKWEIQWDSSSQLIITLISSDGTLLAGASASATGSLYQPRGGSFYLKIGSAGKMTSPWRVKVVELGGAMTTTDSSGSTYIPPTTIDPLGTTNSIAATVSIPGSTNQPGAIPPSTGSSDASSRLTQDQARAIVILKGDAAEGTGFLAQTPEGPVVITNNHVVAANPNIKILTSSGASIPFISLKGAVDRDLVMFTIKDNHYSYLDLETDVEHTVSTGDEVITPGNSQGGEVVLSTDGNILGIGADRIEVNNPIYHGNSGGPIFDVKSDKVIGVVTQAIKVRTTNEIDQASFANSKSAITGEMRYFGFRLDSVPKWETYDLNRFLNESTFLKQFHLASRCLDSLLNGARYERLHLASMDPNDAMPNSQFFLLNESLRSFSDNFHQLSQNAGTSQRLDAQRELILDLQGFADKDMAIIQSPGNFYSFDQIRAKEEIAYRAALKDELENFGDKVSDLGH